MMNVFVKQRVFYSKVDIELRCLCKELDITSKESIVKSILVLRRILIRLRDMYIEFHFYEKTYDDFATVCTNIRERRGQVAYSSFMYTYLSLFNINFVDDKYSFDEFILHIKKNLLDEGSYYEILNFTLTMVRMKIARIIGCFEDDKKMVKKDMHSVLLDSIIDAVNYVGLTTDLMLIE